MGGGVGVGGLSGLAGRRCWGGQFGGPAGGGGCIGAEGRRSRGRSDRSVSVRKGVYVRGGWRGGGFSVAGFRGGVGEGSFGWRGWGGGCGSEGWKGWGPQKSAVGLFCGCGGGCGSRGRGGIDVSRRLGRVGGVWRRCGGACEGFGGGGWWMGGGAGGSGRGGGDGVRRVVEAGPRDGGVRRGAVRVRWGGGGIRGRVIRGSA
ncbi:unnamed protein product [Dicrocoelium dendriticum]|nr:unnamed protein product [Dicrocoelium dendriticum]